MDLQNKWHPNMSRRAVPCHLLWRPVPGGPSLPIRGARNEFLTHAKTIACDEPGAWFRAHQPSLGWLGWAVVGSHSPPHHYFCGDSQSFMMVAASLRVAPRVVAIETTVERPGRLMCFLCIQSGVLLEPCASQDAWYLDVE